MVSQRPGADSPAPQRSSDASAQAYHQVVILAVDIGNSAVKAALVEDGRILGSGRLDTSTAAGEDLLDGLRVLAGAHAEAPRGIIAVSVVDRWTERLERAAERLDLPLTVVAASHIPISTTLVRPDTTGPDRLAGGLGRRQPARRARHRGRPGHRHHRRCGRRRRLLPGRRDHARPGAVGRCPRGRHRAPAASRAAAPARTPSAATPPAHCRAASSSATSVLSGSSPGACTTASRPPPPPAPAPTSS